MNYPTTILALILLALTSWASATQVNVDFGPTGSGTFSGQGPLATTGTPTWNNLQPAAAGTNISNPYLAQNLEDTDGIVTAVDVELTSGFYRAFGDGGTGSLTGDRTFSNNSNVATFTIKDLDPTKTYDLYLISGNYHVIYASGSSSATVTGSSNSTFTDGENYGVLSGLIPDGTGNIAVTITPQTGNQFGVISGLQIIETGDAPPTAIFSSSATFVQKPDTIQLSWTVPPGTSTIKITPDIGDVLPQTTDGSGSISVAPIGNVAYQLIVDGEVAQTIPVVGLPEKSKVHIYLFIGQSNMQGSGRDFDSTLDAPIDKVLQYGSRGGMEDQWVLAQHALTSLGGGSTRIGMGLEFAKTMLAHENDPDVVIGIINHAVGATAIQFWEPGAIDTKHTGAHKLYDEAIQRTIAAKTYGTVKAVLWHQGEYNTNRNSNPSSDPNGYATRLQNLVENLRTDLADPALPFICGKLVPSSWVDANGNNQTYTGLPDRVPVEAALADLPNQKSNTFCVDNNGLRGHNDEKIHFDAYSQRILGVRYANALIGINADPLQKFLGGFYNPTELLDPGIGNPEADPDHDGITNIEEFAFLTDPSVLTTDRPYQVSQATAENEGTYPVFEFRMRTDDDAPSYILESSTDLTTWKNNQNSPSDIHLPLGIPTDNGDGTVTQEFRYHLPYHLSPEKLFFHLKIEL
ncbi:hypothetical protein NT6N_11230 [Oceaniferula spumae]|uniref:Sialate O-acetylesterase domain-containing protein n=1 Tax=Oceaniferula spumae TaxID=2979115 RepID=A0AAT9FJ91_9BACT